MVVVGVVMMWCRCWCRSRWCGNGVGDVLLAGRRDGGDGGGGRRRGCCYCWCGVVMVVVMIVVGGGGGVRAAWCRCW